MKVLTVDQGNTLMKMTLYDNCDEIASAAVPTFSPEESLPIVDDWKPEGGVFCSVGRFDIRFVETLRQLVDDRLLVLTPHTSLPISIDYATPDTLGVDRIALACGAALLYPGEGNVIADCGSCVTIDLLDADGVFRGGRIAPGLSMRIKAMNSFTARLPIIDGCGDVELLGRTTEQSLRSGVVYGMAHELTGALTDYSREKPVRRLVITGGDAGTLYPFIKETAMELSQPFDGVYVPKLLNNGLLFIFYHNRELGNI